MISKAHLNQGAFLDEDNKCVFKIWAPEATGMVLHLVYPSDRKYMMNRLENGYFTITLENIKAGTKYFYNPDNKGDTPDPASFFQPDGVHGPSEVVDHNLFRWEDAKWKGIPIEELIFYEIHTGAFTAEGTFEGIEARLDELSATGINAILLMPLGQFPGTRNWGYDGVYSYAVQNSYGGPQQLKKLVNACHKKGLAVFLDVVYNHLGPEGNYLSRYGPYYTSRYSTPWGQAINYDGPDSDEVRNFFLDNLLYWCFYFHIDGLRFDAIHAIFDNRADMFWHLVRERINALQQLLGKRIYIIAESDLNSPRVTDTTDKNGYGFDAQWLDDFHHAVYARLYPEALQQYVDFGATDQVITALKDGFVHSGQYVKARKRRHGLSSANIPGKHFIAFIQNHDQVGNGIGGKRLQSLIGIRKMKIAATLLFMSPYIPLLFMGEEYGEEQPFLYFIDHSEASLIESVRKGRKEEFSRFFQGTEPPDPQHPGTFIKSKLGWRTALKEEQKDILRWYEALISLRKSHPAMRISGKEFIAARNIDDRGISILRFHPLSEESLFVVLNLGNDILVTTLPGNKKWQQLIASDPAINLSDGLATLPPLSATIFKGWHNS